GTRSAPDASGRDKIGIAHAGGGLGSCSRAHFFLDAPTDISVYAFPVFERTLEYRTAYASEERTGYGVDQTAALGFVEHLANQRAGLAEVVVLGMQGVGAAHHVSVRYPGLFHLAGVVGPATVVGARRIYRLIAAVLVRHLPV